MSDAPARRVIAHRPDLQRQVDAFWTFLNGRGWSLSRLCRELYGVNEGGKTRGAGSVQPIARGARAPGVLLAEAWRERTGLDLTPFAAKAALGGRRPKLASVAAVTRARAAVAEYERVKSEVVGAPAKPKEAPEWQAPGPRLAVTLTHDGVGSLTFNLVNAPAAEVMRALGVLQAAGLALQIDEDSC
jgi:hypothetical protein